MTIYLRGTIISAIQNLEGEYLCNPTIYNVADQ